jgi:ABC-2 type transport system permease protein
MMDFCTHSLYLLWTTAAAAVVLGALLHRRLYLSGFSRAQESAERWVRAGAGAALARRWLTPLGTLRRELVLKELRLFFRDTTQWSQLILLAVLVVVYVFNIKFLPLRTEGVTKALTIIIPFLNLVLAGFVLASIAARFIFPAVSLEGRTLWLLRSSPMRMRDLLWAKFWVGTTPLLVLALIIVGITDFLLQVPPFMFAVSLLTITGLTFAVCGLAIGFGTIFPQFETENAAQIPTSFGGLLYMMSSVAVIGGVVILEARPVAGYGAARLYNAETSPGEMILWFSLAAAVCVAATVLPIREALRRLEKVER